MKQTEIRKGRRVVILTEDMHRFSARVYLNDGETASVQCWKGKTRKGAEVCAKRMLNA